MGVITGRAGLACAIGAAAAALCGAAAGAPQSRAATPTTGELVGQRLIVSMAGTTPSASLLQRVRRGEIGGVILFGANITGPAQLRALTARLQAVARAAGRPALLIATDQEGGDIRRLPWAGPTLPAPGLGHRTASQVRAEARAAGRELRAAGVNVDLAPVADVPADGSFLAAQQRTFSTNPAAVGWLSAAFAAGLRDAHVLATAKHFPGIGRAVRNTDLNAVTITASASALARDLSPFRTLVAQGVPLVMLSNASYSIYGDKPAAWSPRLLAVLHGSLGFRGATITDALDALAVTHKRSLPSVAALAAQTGVDLLLLTGTEASSAAAYDHLAALAASGRIGKPSLQRSYDRVIALKARGA